MPKEGVGSKGLSTKEAALRLARYGPNEINDSSKTSPLRILARQVKNNFIIYLLCAAMIVSFFVGKNTTGYTILLVITLVITIGFIQEFRAEKAIAALKKMIMPISIVLRDGKETEVQSREIVLGDILILRSGERIPADCVLVEEHNLLVNESILTGESQEIKKQVGQQKKEKAENALFMGTFVVNGRCVACVIHTGMDTKFGKISGLISSIEKEFPLQEKLNKVSKYMAIVAVVFSLITGAIMLVQNGTGNGYILEVLLLIIALCVASFPEGLPVVLITALAFGSHTLAQNNAIVNRMSVIETLGETTVICSDKTGTITKGEMTASRIYINGEMIDVSGTGYDGKGEFKRGDSVINPHNDLELLFQAVVLCNDSKIERIGNDMDFKITGTPTEAALLVLAAKGGVYREDSGAMRLEEIPFNSSRKMMSVVYKLNKKNLVFTKGAPEILLPKCSAIQKGASSIILTQQERAKILATNAAMTRGALRTLAVAYKEVREIQKDQLEEQLIFIGLLGIKDPPREEVKYAIETCVRAGIAVKMITGDNKETALSIGHEIGLRGKVLVGDELDTITDHELTKVVMETIIFARVRPEHKIRIVRALKANGEIVTMTGDGVNDAPALKEAHIGVAMGKNGTDVSRSVADLTLRDDNFATIVTAIREGRTIFKNIRKFTSYMLSCNYAELIVLFLGVVLSPFLGWQVPVLVALQILFMNLVTDDLPAITLSLTPGSADIMLEKPRKKEGILTRPIFLWSLIAGFSMAFITLFSYYVSFNVLGNSTEYSRTIALVVLICAEIANAYNFMSYRKMVSIRSVFVNKFLFGASSISLLATIVIIYTPLNTVFETVPLGLIDWVIALGISSLMVILFDILKWINNKKRFFELDTQQ